MASTDELPRVSVRMNQALIDQIDAVVAHGTYVDRSEVIREAVRRFTISEQR